jgi:23S rRNA (uridine2552-2'-O)-methyltransferase
VAKRSKSSARWLKEHFDDPFVKQAQAEGLRSRAVFKLKEIDEKDKLFKRGRTVLDLGAAPGGWAAYARDKLDASGKVIAIDLLPMLELTDVTFIQGDFLAESTHQALEQALAGKRLDLILCDMAPNTSGVLAVDQARSMYLAESVLEFAAQFLDPQGDLLIKVFQGEGFESYLTQCRAMFKKVLIRKPEASRGRSREHYLLGRELRSQR